MNNFNARNQKDQAFLEKFLLRKKIVSDQQQAKVVSLGIMVLIIVVCVIAVFITISSQSEEIDEKYYYDPTRTDATN